MQSVFRIFICFILILVLGVIYVPSSHSIESEDIRDLIGQDVPLFILRDLHGARFQMRDHLGKVILINFFYVGCKPCEKEIPVLDKIRRSYSSSKFKLVVINAVGDSTEKIKMFFRDITRTPDMNAIVDSLQLQSKRFNVKGVPATFIVNKKGKIVDAAEGYRFDSVSPRNFERQLRNKIDRLF